MRMRYVTGEQEHKHTKYCGINLLYNTTMNLRGEGLTRKDTKVRKCKKKTV